MGHRSLEEGRTLKPNISGSTPPPPSPGLRYQSYQLKRIIFGAFRTVNLRLILFKQHRFRDLANALSF